MRTDHLAGTSIPRFTYDTPSAPGNDFYALCSGEQPLVLLFLPALDHPIAREYIARYLRTLPALGEVRLACVVRSSARQAAGALGGRELPFPLICDEPGVLYSFMGVETAGLLNWSFAAQRIFKDAQSRGLHYDRKAPQLLPLTLVIGAEGRILFSHYGRSLTDLPDDCAALREICDEVTALRARADAARPSPQKGAPASPHADETLTLPDLAGLVQDDEDALGSLFD